jgi:hypothetical protein
MDTGVKLPVIAMANGGQATKVGTSTCTSVLTLFAWGDASIDAAMKNRGITKVHHVDWDVSNVLGIIGTYKVTVYGEHRRMNANFIQQSTAKDASFESLETVSFEFADNRPEVITQRKLQALTNSNPQVRQAT